MIAGHERAGRAVRVIATISVMALTWHRAVADCNCPQTHTFLLVCFNERGQFRSQLQMLASHFSHAAAAVAMLLKKNPLLHIIFKPLTTACTCVHTHTHSQAHPHAHTHTFLYYRCEDFRRHNKNTALTPNPNHPQKPLTLT